MLTITNKKYLQKKLNVPYQGYVVVKAGIIWIIRSEHMSWFKLLYQFSVTPVLIIMYLFPLAVL